MKEKQAAERCALLWVIPALRARVVVARQASAASSVEAIAGTRSSPIVGVDMRKRHLCVADAVGTWPARRPFAAGVVVMQRKHLCVGDAVVGTWPARLPFGAGVVVARCAPIPVGVGIEGIDAMRW